MRSLSDAEHLSHLARVRREHGSAIELMKTLRRFLKARERRRIQNKRRPPDARQHAFHQPRDSLLVNHPRPDQHGLHFLPLRNYLLARGSSDCARSRFRQSEDARFRHCGGDHGRDAAARGNLQLPCARTQGGGRREDDRARHLRCAADDQHAPALLLIATFVRLRQRPTTQQRRRDEQGSRRQESGVGICLSCPGPLTPAPCPPLFISVRLGHLVSW